MADYFSGYKGRGGPAIDPGIVSMMGSIGEEYGKGIEALGEGIANYRKNKAETSMAQSNFENALSRMDAMYGEEPGDYQMVLNAVDGKIMQKIQDGKGTKEDFLSALNSLNTVGEFIEQRRDDAAKQEQFDTTADIRREQNRISESLGLARITSAEDMQGREISARKEEGDAGRKSREGMQDKDISARKGMQTEQLTATQKMQTERLAQDKAQFKQKLDQDFFLEMGRQGLSEKEIAQRYQTHTESLEQAWNLAQDQMAQKAREHADQMDLARKSYQLKVNAVQKVADEAKSKSEALQIMFDDSKRIPDVERFQQDMRSSSDAPSRRNMIYMESGQVPPEYMRKETGAEKALKALDVPGLDADTQDKIAEMANTSGGSVRFIKHPETNSYLAVTPTRTISLGRAGKTSTEIQIAATEARDRFRAMENTKKAIILAKQEKRKSLDKLTANFVDADDPEFTKAEEGWDTFIAELEAGLPGNKSPDSPKPEVESVWRIGEDGKPVKVEGN